MRPKEIMVSLFFAAAMLLLSLKEIRCAARLKEKPLDTMCDAIGFG